MLFHQCYQQIFHKLVRQMIDHQKEKRKQQTEFQALNISAISSNQQEINIQQLNKSDNIDLRSIQFPVNQQIQINLQQFEREQQPFINESSGEPIQGSFMKEMQQLYKTLSFESKRYNIYSDSILNSSKDCNSSNKSFKEAILGFMNQKNELTDDQTTSIQRNIQQKQLKINIMGNFEGIQLKYIVDFQQSKNDQNKYENSEQKIKLTKNKQKKRSLNKQRFELNKDNVLKPLSKMFPNKIDCNGQITKQNRKKLVKQRGIQEDKQQLSNDN